ncbi:hypothetical protein EDD21DRAFT_378692 [Dissophora ornata]|nr:hypothetical protein EDD21DRAFT_378692 [Dissophora ornata]
MSPTTAAIAAAAAFRGNTLFVHYSTTENNLGTLYALSPTSTPAGSTNSNALLIQPQTILVDGLTSLGPSQARSTSGTASLVSTTTINPGAGYRHDLILAFNMPTPFLFRLTPASPNNGGDLSSSANSSSWTLVDQSKSITAMSGVLQLSLSSGITGSGASVGQASSEGSAVYELLSSAISTALVKMDVSGTTGMPYVPLPSMISHQLSTVAPPKVIRLTDSGKFDVVVVGGCNTTTVATPDETCLWFSGDMGNAVSITNMPYDPTSCIVEANGSIIVASSTNIYTYPYTGIVQSGNWTVRQPSGIVPNLPSPILACSTANSTLYAVTQGHAGMPSIHSIDLTSSNWDWQTVQLLQTSANGTGTVPLSSSGSSGASEDSNNSTGGNKSLSPAVIAVIIVVVVVALLLALLAFLWKRRRSRQKSTFRMDDQAEKTAFEPGPTQGYSPSYNGSVVTTSSGAPVVGGALPDTQECPEVEQSTNSHVPSELAAQAPPIQISRPWTPQDSFVQSSSTPIRANVVAGDKQELFSEEIVIPSKSAVSNRLANQSSAHLQPGTSTPGTANNPRIQHVISPGLANAQLILQQSQTPPNQAPPIGPDGRHY